MDFSSYIQPIEGNDRDLNYAVKSKAKLVAKIDRLTDSYNRFDLPESQATIAQMFYLTSTLDYSNKEGIKTLKAIGKYLCRVARGGTEGANYVFQQWVERMQSVDFKDEKQVQTGYLWLLLLQQRHGSYSSSFVSQFDANQALFVQLYQGLSQGVTVTPELAANSLSWLWLDNLLDYYFYHSNSYHIHFGQWLLALVHRNPEVGDSLSLAVLERSEGYPQLILALAEIFLQTRLSEQGTRLGYAVFFNLFNPHPPEFKKDMPKFRKLQQAINLELETRVTDWSEQQLSNAANIFCRIHEDQQTITTRCAQLPELQQRMEILFGKDLCRLK